MTLIGEHIPLRIASSQGLGADAARKTLSSISREGEPQHNLTTENFPPTDESIFNFDQVSWTSWKIFAIILSGIFSGSFAAAVVLLHDISFLTAFFTYVVMGNAGSLVTALIISFIPPD